MPAGSGRTGGVPKRKKKKPCEIESTSVRPFLDITSPHLPAAPTTVSIAVMDCTSLSSVTPNFQILTKKADCLLHQLMSLQLLHVQ